MDCTSLLEAAKRFVDASSQYAPIKHVLGPGIQMDDLLWHDEC